MYHVGSPEMLEGKQVFSTYWDAHLEKRLEEDEVR
jgi:hypothetical protein